MEHLFDRFYRAESSRTNSRENHGLGLAIVKAVAEMHRGSVSASSEHGINTFAFSVARFGNEHRAMNPDAPSPNASGAPIAGAAQPVVSGSNASS
jgi:two-component system, OmpR family, heavy metal sensor histidine kinase CusS